MKSNPLKPAASEEDLDVILEHMDDAKSADDCLAQVFKIFDIYGLGHGCLHRLESDYSPSEALWRVVPDDVTTACSYLVKMNKHPALLLGKNRQFAFDLFDYRHLFTDDPDVENLYKAFLNNGLEHAYGLPIQTNDRGTYVFVIGRPGPAIDTVELLTLQAICSNAVNQVKQFQARPCDVEKIRKLSANERNILISVANGESDGSIAEQLDLSEMTIKILKEKIISELCAQNLSHAIVLALVEGEISFADCVSDG